MPAMRGGFSLVEVVITLSVLVVALLLIVGQQANVLALQRSTRDAAQVDRLLQALVERFHAVPATHVATELAPWSVARYEQVDPATGSHRPLGQSTRGRDPLTVAARTATGDPVAPGDHLVQLGLVAGTDVPADLRVYVEYYRALDWVDGAGAVQEGLLDEGAATPAAFRTAAYVDPARPERGIRARFDLENWNPSDTSAGNNPWQRGLVPAEHPLLIRLVAVWEDADPDPLIYRPRQRRELFTAKVP